MNPLEHLVKAMDIGYALGAGLPIPWASGRKQALQDRRVVPAIADRFRDQIEDYKARHGQYPDVTTAETLYTDAYADYWNEQEESAREDVRRVRGA